MTSGGRSRVASGFDRLAPGYDLLARAAFGNAIRRSQSHFLARLPQDADVLVLGGGSGWFLERLLAVAECRSVLYVEISGGMLDRAEERIGRRRPEDLAKVRFLRGGPEAVPADARFDIVCTHCFLDLFTDETLRTVTGQLTGHLRPDGVWYFSDFRIVPGAPMSALSGLVVSALYLFFGLVCGIEARRLPSFEDAFRACGLERIEECHFLGGMLSASLLARRDETCAEPCITARQRWDGIRSDAYRTDEIVAEREITHLPPRPSESE